MTAIAFFDRVYRDRARYWHHPNRDSIEPTDFPEPWRTLLRRLARKAPGRALDLGAGEGGDAIRLARLGYEVDAVEGSSVAAQKIEGFARVAGVRIGVLHADARSFTPVGLYDVIICSGLLHYLEPAHQQRILEVLKGATVPGGFNLVMMFTDWTPVPDCHRVTDIFPDREQGLLAQKYFEWNVLSVTERDKLDIAHHDFLPHQHSFLKLLARKPDAA